jgi:hypothetical protein
MRAAWSPFVFAWLLTAGCDTSALSERQPAGSGSESLGAALTVGAGVPFTAPGTAVMQPGFGTRAIALSGQTLLVTAFKEAAAGGDPGHTGPVFAFVRTPTGWVEQGRLDPPEPGARTQFGLAVAVSGDRAIVGAPGRGEGQGGAYVFARTNGVWALEATLLPEGRAPIVGGREQFGASVALAGDLAVVGAEYYGTNALESAGGAYVYAREGGQWNKKTVLRPSRAQLVYPLFGRKVALEGRLIAVAAPSQDSDGKTGTGGVYLFEDAGGTGRFTETAYVAPNDVVAADNFGGALALSGGVLAVGAAFSDNGYFPPRIGPENVGKVYTFERSSSGSAAWAQTARLTTTSVGLTRFGGSVALHNRLLLIGAPDEDGLAGAAYLYRASGGGWELVKRISDGIPGTNDFARSDYLGGFVALDRQIAVVGGNPVRVPLRVFDLHREAGDACADPTDCDSGFCVDGVCCSTACGDGMLDCQACSLAAGGTQNGLCTPLAPMRAGGVVCRVAGGACDLAETCSSGALQCPPDVPGAACIADAGSSPSDAAPESLSDAAIPAQDASAVDAGEDAAMVDVGGEISIEPSADGGLRDAGADALVDAPTSDETSDGCTCGIGHTSNGSPLPPASLPFVAGLIAVGCRRRRRH